MKNPPATDRRLSRHRSEANFERADRPRENSAGRHHTRDAKRAWSRANRRHGKTLASAPY